MDTKTDSTFHYNYSASQQEEIQKIRARYISAGENKLEQLRKLDQSVTRPGTILSVLVGTLGTMLFGTGMSCIMVWTETMFLPGVLIGIAGLAGIAAAYPAYLAVTRKQRKKAAPEILRLTEELMQ